MYWAAYYMVAFGNTRVSFCVVKWLLLLLPLLFPPPIVQVFISLRTLISHCPLVRSLAPASLWCSFQHPHISPATCKGLTCDAWHFALPSQHARSTSVLVLWVAWCPHCVKGRVPQVKTCTGTFCKLAALLHVLAAQKGTVWKSLLLSNICVHKSHKETKTNNVLGHLSALPQHVCGSQTQARLFLLKTCKNWSGCRV